MPLVKDLMLLILIESQWNLKADEFVKLLLQPVILIESQWNLKHLFHMLHRLQLI